MRVFARLCLYLGILLLAAAAIGQWRVGRFPAYRDLLMAPLFALGALIFVWIILKLAILAFPVKVHQRGLRCYDEAARYHTVEWHRIRSVYEQKVYGIPYLFVEGEGLHRPLTVPLWLQDMAGFRRETERLAGHTNVLVQALDKVTKQPQV